MWDKLSMYDRAKVIKLGVDSGVTDLDQIKRAYNTYAEGGYMDWLNAVKQWRPGINEDIEAAEPTYDYEGFFFDNPEYAWKMLQGDPEAHFTDKYKRPNHPTFSDESIYSTPETPGGKWHENYGGSGRWVYEPSDYTRQHIEETRRYLENSGEGYLDGMNVVFPNRYQKGGHMSPYSAGAMVDAIYEGAKNVESLGKPSHGYDFTQSEEWADAHGYYPDERGHRDDRVKKPSHPTHPSRGKWNGMNEFQLTDRGMEDPNYVRFGMADGGQDPQAVLTHDGAIVLPEFTVTPNGNYIHNSYDNLNISYSRGGRVNRFDDGGPEDRLISTGNEYADIGLSFVPFVGSAMDIEDAIRNPTLGNIGWAALSTAADFFGGSLIKGALKGAKRGKQALNAIDAAEKSAKRYERAKHAATVNPTKGTRKTARRTYKEMKAAEATRRVLAPTRRGRTARVRRPVTRYTVPMDNTKLINAKTVYGLDAVSNGVQQGTTRK